MQRPAQGHKTSLGFWSGSPGSTPGAPSPPLQERAAPRCAAPRPGRQGAAPRFPRPQRPRTGVAAPGPRGAPPAPPDLASTRGTPNARPGPRSCQRARPRPTLHLGLWTAPPGAPLGRGWSSVASSPRASCPKAPGAGTSRVAEARVQAPPPRPGSSGGAAAAPARPSPGGAPLRALTRSGHAAAGPRLALPGPASSRRVGSHRRRPCPARALGSALPPPLPAPCGAGSRSPSRARRSSALPSPAPPPPACLPVGPRPPGARLGPFPSRTRGSPKTPPVGEPVARAGVGGGERWAPGKASPPPAPVPCASLVGYFFSI